MQLLLLIHIRAKVWCITSSISFFSTLREHPPVDFTHSARQTLRRITPNCGPSHSTLWRARCPSIASESLQTDWTNAKPYLVMCKAESIRPKFFFCAPWHPTYIWRPFLFSPPYRKKHPFTVMLLTFIHYFYQLRTSQQNLYGSSWTVIRCKYHQLPITHPKEFALDCR